MWQPSEKILDQSILCSFHQMATGWPQEAMTAHLGYGMYVLIKNWSIGKHQGNKSLVSNLTRGCKRWPTAAATDVSSTGTCKYSTKLAQLIKTSPPFHTSNSLEITLTTSSRAPKTT